jgi:glycosyltransferase involved in cell wall biosynthesis
MSPERSAAQSKGAPFDGTQGAPFNKAQGPLVSIITPSYNQADYLDLTIQSVLGQDYPHIEYIIVDGASTDGSVEIIRRHAGRLAWWVSEPDRGQAEAINKGFQRASGEVIAWLNSDDLYLPGAVARAVRALQANPTLGLVYGDALTIDAQGKPLNWLSFGDWGLRELIRFRIICQPAVFMRRAVLERAGHLDPAYHMMLDHHLWIRMAQQAPVQYLGQAGRLAPLAAARHHPQAKNTSQPEKFAQETLRVLRWLETQPGLQAAVAQGRRQVNGGAYRLVGRYLLDGGAYAGALRAYGRAFVNWPGYTLKHWHRILYAALSLLGLGKTLDRLRESETQQQRAQLVHRLKDDEMIGARLDSWPGICLE